MVLSAFSVSTLMSFLLLPLVVMLVFAVVLIPTLSSPGAKPSQALKAVYCVALQVAGIVLMTGGALPAMYGVLEKFTLGVERFSAEMYLAMLILFCAGGITFLWHEQAGEDIDDASRRVPALLFWYTFKILGYLLTLFSVLSLLFTALLLRGPLPLTWWISPATLFLYGLLLCWCTRTTASPRAKPFGSTPMKGRKK